MITGKMVLSSGDREIDVQSFEHPKDAVTFMEIEFLANGLPYKYRIDFDQTLVVEGSDD